MATLSLSAISVAMSILLMDGLTKQFRQDIPLLHLLNIKTGAGKALFWNPKFDARSAGGAYAEGADMSDSDYDSHTRVQATLAWAAYRAGAKVSGLAEAVSASGGYAGGASVFQEELEDAIDKVATDLGTDLYGGDPTAAPTELAGAATAIDSSGTFASIDPTSYTGWAAGENAIATADLSIQNIREKLFRPVKDATGRRPDFVTLAGDIYDSVAALFDDKAEVREISVGGNTVDIVQSFGGQGFYVDGVPFIEDRFATASTMYAWSSRFVEIVQLPAVKPNVDAAEVVAAIKQLTGVDVQVADVEARIRSMRENPGALIPFVEMLSQTGDAYKAQVKVYVQLKWKRRNAFSKLILT